MTVDVERSARFGPFVLDLRTGELLRKGRKIHLQPQPFQLLALLLERSGEVVALDEIRAELWPDAPFGDFEHGVSTAVKKLRDALNDSPIHPFYIETLRRRGYRFIAPLTYHSRRPTQDAASRSRVIVGREALIDELLELLQLASSQQERQLVFLSGEAGMGKSAVVDELMRRALADDSGVQVIRGQCVEGFGGKEPYYPILEALDELCRAPAGPASIALITEHAPTLLVQLPVVLKRQDRERLQRDTAGATRERMLREARQALEAIASGKPLIVALEDLQWVDPSTLDLIAALTRQRTPAGLMIIGTYRPAEVSHGAHPLKTLKQELTLHSLCREIPLGRLSESAIAAYLAALAPDLSVPPGLATVVHRHSGGNPLFMITALEHLQARGLVTRGFGGWQLQMPPEQIPLEVPETLREMIEAQIARLTAEEQRALEIASVAGIAFSVDVCTAAVAEAGAEAFEETCERLARRHHILRQLDTPGSAHYEFLHPLCRQVLYERQPRGKRVLLHRRVAEQMEIVCRDRLSDVASELAVHFEEASDWTRSVHYFRIASHTAEAGHAYAQACVLLEHALHPVSMMPDDERAVHEIAILEKLALLYVSASDLRAIATFETLCARAAHYGYLEVEVRALTSMAFPLSWISTERCLLILERALVLCSGLRDPVLRATTRASCLALRLSVTGWSATDAAEFRKVLEEIRASGDPLLIASHQVDLSSIQLSSTAYRDAHRSAVESISTLAGHENNLFLSPAAWKGQVYAVWSLLFLGEWGKAWDEIGAAMAQARRNQNDRRLQSYRLLLAWLHLMCLDHTGTLEIVRSGVDADPDPARTVANRFSMILAGAAETGLGHQQEALALLLRARQDMERQAVTRDVYWRMTLESSLAELWLTKDDAQQARIHVEVFLATALKTADRTWQALAWELSARIAIRMNDLQLARECVLGAFAAMDQFEVPLAAWRVNATAAELCERQGNDPLADDYRDQSVRVILSLANSLIDCEPLQRSFVSAPIIRRILGTEAMF